MNSYYSPIFICQVLGKLASKGPRYKAFKSDSPAKILPYEFIHGQVSAMTLTLSVSWYYSQEERLLRMGDELSRLASYEAECHRKDGVIAALRDEVVDLKGALQSNGFRYSSVLNILSSSTWWWSDPLKFLVKRKSWGTPYMCFKEGSGA